MKKQDCLPADESLASYVGLGRTRTFIGMTFADGRDELGDTSVGEDDLQLSPAVPSRETTLDPGPQLSHQRLVFADPSAFRYTHDIKSGLITYP